MCIERALMASMLGACHLLGNHNQATVVRSSARMPQATCKPWMRKRGRYIIGTEKMNLQGIMCGTPQGDLEPVEVGGLSLQRRAHRVLGGGAARHLLLLR